MCGIFGTILYLAENAIHVFHTGRLGAAHNRLRRRRLVHLHLHFRILTQTRAATIQHRVAMNPGRTPFGGKISNNTKVRTSVASRSERGVGKSLHGAVQTSRSAVSSDRDNGLILSSSDDYILLPASNGM